MKALSIRQPWAWLIVNGLKSLENRTWATNFRGAFLVHASHQPDMNQKEYSELRQAVHDDFDVWMPENIADLPCGGIVGQAEIVDCVSEVSEEIDLIWHEEGCFAFLLDNPKPLPFQPMHGKLNFFEVHPYQP